MLTKDQQPLFKLSISAIFVALTILILNLTDIDDKIWYFIHDLTINKETEGNSIWLPKYQADIVELQIPGVADNASGITYDRDSETLWIIVNNPTYAVEIDLQFNLLRRIELKNFEDTEAITYIGNDLYLLADERDQTITLAKISNQTKQLDKNDLEQIVLDLHEYGNKGLEGIAVDYRTNTIFTVRERDPIKLIKVTGFIENNNRINIETFDQIEVKNLYVDDLSGLHFDINTDHLLLLSDESKLLAEMDLQGNKISYMDLEKGFNNLDRSIPQPEGITLDDKGHLYIVSEPNLLYRFKKAE
jgi:uncharacterized protein YjiK